RTACPRVSIISPKCRADKAVRAPLLNQPAEAKCATKRTVFSGWLSAIFAEEREQTRPERRTPVQPVAHGVPVPADRDTGAPAPGGPSRMRFAGRRGALRRVFTRKPGFIGGRPRPIPRRSSKVPLLCTSEP